MKQQIVILRDPSGRTGDYRRQLEELGARTRGGGAAWQDAGPVIQFDKADGAPSPDTSPPPAPALDELKVEVEEATAGERARIAREKDVLATAPAMPLSVPEPVANDALASNEAHDDEADPNALSVTWGVRTVGADRSSFDGANATVAVLDTGIDAAHPAFAGGGLQLITRNFTTESDDDLNGHGTHCAGTIFGRDVAGTRIGVAPGVRRALIGKVIGGGAGTKDLLDAMKWAVDQGANVISMSLGFDFVGYRERLADHFGYAAQAATSAALEAYRSNVRMFDQWMALNSAQAAIGKSAMVVAAAGNESRRNGANAYEVATSSPASAAGVVSVGALFEGGGGLDVASFSNTGPRIAAPGVSVVSAWPGGGLRALNGTSMACPHVAGCAALFWDEMAQSPVQPTPDRVIGRLTANAEHSGVFVNGIDFADIGVGLCRAP